MSTEDADEKAVRCWRQMADENDQRARHLSELAYEMFNLDDARFALREAKLLREQARRFRDAAAGWTADAAAAWKAGDRLPKSGWFLVRAEDKPEEFRIVVVNDATTQYRALRPLAVGWLPEDEMRRKLENCGFAPEEIDARIEGARKAPRKLGS
jgi:hypothetical protein